MRITPTVCRSTPDTSAETAHVRIAPTAIRMRLTPMPMFVPLGVVCLADAFSNSERVSDVTGIPPAHTAETGDVVARPFPERAARCTSAGW